MNKLELAKFFIEEAIRNDDKVKELKNDEQLVKSSDDWCKFYSKWNNIPKKSVTLDNVKMARRLLNEWRKENEVQN